MIWNVAVWYILVANLHGINRRLGWDVVRVQNVSQLLKCVPQMPLPMVLIWFWHVRMLQLVTAFVAIYLNFQKWIIPVPHTILFFLRTMPQQWTMSRKYWMRNKSRMPELKSQPVLLLAHWAVIWLVKMTSAKKTCWEQTRARFKAV